MWNQWFRIGEYAEEEYGPLTEESALKYFLEHHVDPARAETIEIDDDQYNLVLMIKDDRRPLMAIEYGSSI